MGVLPAHRRLDHRVHPVKRVGRRDQHPPPHRRVSHILQRDPHFEQRVAGLRHAPEAPDGIPAEISEFSAVI